MFKSGYVLINICAREKHEPAPASFVGAPWFPLLPAWYRARFVWVWNAFFAKPRTPPISQWTFYAKPANRAQGQGRNRAVYVIALGPYDVRFRSPETMINNYRVHSVTLRVYLMERRSVAMCLRRVYLIKCNHLILNLYIVSPKIRL